MSLELLEHYIQTADVKSLGELLERDEALATTTTSHQVSPLMLACYFKKPAIISLLLTYVHNIDLFEACAAGKFDSVAHLVYNHPEMVNEYSADGFTPLGLACYFGHPQIASFLVLKGADVNAPSNNGFSVFPLHSAAAANQNEIVHMLLEHGAQANVKQKSGVTPLHSAAQNGNLEILIMLLEHGATVNARMEGGKLPADLAEEKGFMDIAAILSD